MPLDERRLLLNGLQPSRLSSAKDAYVSTRPAKRPKTEGMNSRFDQMIRTVNVMHGCPPATANNHRRGYGRIPSSSSGTTHEIPKTTLDVHQPGDDDRLGHDFSVVKMRYPGRSVTHHVDIYSPEAFRGPEDPISDPAERLPPWLQGTISSLNWKHPLRLLVSGRPASQGDSSPSALDSSSDPLPTPGPEESPFAFVVPDYPRAKVSSTITYNDHDTYSHEMPTDPIVLNHSRSPAGPRIDCTRRGVEQLNFARTRSRHSARPARISTPVRPFSTPGPASILGGDAIPGSTHTAQPQVYGPPPVPHDRLSAVSADLDECDLAEPFVPFSTPGPVCAAIPPARVPTFFSQTRELADFLQTHSPPRAVDSPAVRPLMHSPELHWQRVPTTAYHASSRHSGIPRHASVSPATSRPPSGTAHSPKMNFMPFATPGPGHTSAHLARPQKSGRSPGLAPSGQHLVPVDAYSALLSPYASPPKGLQRNLDPGGDSIDFRWERFDRGHTLLELSSSPRDGAAGSEETFWSQPAQVFQGFIEAGQQRIPHTSPQAVLEHRPTPHPPSPAFRYPDTAAAGAGTSTRPHDTVEGERSPFGPQEEGDGGPFAWIVPPRDQPPPSTPRRTSTTPVVEPQPSSTRAGAPAGEQSQEDADTVPSAKLGEAQDEDGARVHPCAPSFAPAPGIYLSPLRGEDGAADKDGASAHSAPVAVARSPRGEACRQSRVALHNERAEVQDAITQSPREVPPGGDVDAEVTADEIEEADELNGESSQESRDTIESWSS